MLIAQPTFVPYLCSPIQIVIKPELIKCINNSIKSSPQIPYDFILHSINCVTSYIKQKYYVENLNPNRT